MSRGYGIASLVWVLLLGGLSGCVSTLASHQVADNQVRTEKEFTLLQPLHVPRGQGPEGCGAQALAAAAAYVDPSIDAETLCMELPWSTTGATAPEILIAARKRGLTAKLSQGNWQGLRNGIENNHPTLVLLDSRDTVSNLFIGDTRAGIAQYHWAVVSGLSENEHRVLLAAPKDRDYELKQDEFISRWSESKFCAIEISSNKGRPQ